MNWQNKQMEKAFTYICLYNELNTAAHKAAINTAAIKRMARTNLIPTTRPPT